jgi:7-cyano-7-deazaguanine synthase in queuosine biosynthesis
MTYYRAPGPQLQLISGAPANTLLQDHAVELWHGTCGRPMRPDWAGPPELLAYLRGLYEDEGEQVELGVTRDPIVDDTRVPAPWVDPGRLTAGQLWVAFSGGKDGLGAALMARDAGYQVVLFHVAGLNRGTAKAEHAAAERAAEAADMPLVVDHVKQRGSRAGFIEVPTRNQFVVTLMAAHMAKAGAGTYTMGNALSDVAQGYLVAHSDLVDAVSRWHRWLQVLLPGLEQRTFLRHQTEGIAVIAKHGLTELAHGSCMAPVRFREGYISANERRYGVQLLPGRCGSCGKCTWEYLVLAALGYPAPEAFLQHCLRYMQRHWQDATSETHTEQQVLDTWVDSAIVAEYQDEMPW